jgi:hypothetical protein
LCGASYLEGYASGLAECLGRGAAIVYTRTADTVTFDKRDAPTLATKRNGKGGRRLAGTNDYVIKVQARIMIVRHAFTSTPRQNAT